MPLIKNPEQSHLTSNHWTHTKWTTAYDVGNPDPGLGQAQKCGWVKPHKIPQTITMNYMDSTIAGIYIDGPVFSICDFYW
jgi:hypothetical protein